MVLGQEGASAAFGPRKGRPAFSARVCAFVSVGLKAIYDYSFCNLDTSIFSLRIPDKFFQGPFQSFHPTI